MTDLGDWYIILSKTEGTSVIDFAKDFNEAYRKADSLSEIYPEDTYQVVHESRLGDYLELVNSSDNKND